MSDWRGIPDWAFWCLVAAVCVFFVWALVMSILYGEHDCAPGREYVRVDPPGAFAARASVAPEIELESA